jgi:hypothetical protein
MRTVGMEEDEGSGQHYAAVHSQSMHRSGCYWMVVMFTLSSLSLDFIPLVSGRSSFSGS